MTDITTGRLGPVVPAGESQGNHLQPDARKQHKKRPRSSPIPDDPDSEDLPEPDDANHQIDELA